MTRRPEHFEDQGPNEPEPRRFLRETPQLFWWVAAGLGVLTVIGMVAVWVTQRESDEPNSTAQEDVAAARDEPREVRLTDSGFEPGDADVPRNQELLVLNESGSECRLTVEGNEGMAVPQGEVGTASPGGEVSWIPEEPGQYAVRCDGAEHLLRVTVP
jgi:hypothetical protein